MGVIYFVPSDRGVSQYLIGKGVKGDPRSGLKTDVVFDSSARPSLNPYGMGIAVLSRRSDADMMNRIPLEQVMAWGVVCIADVIDAVSRPTEVTIDDFHVVAVVAEGQ